MITDLKVTGCFLDVTFSPARSNDGDNGDAFHFHISTDQGGQDMRLFDSVTEGGKTVRSFGFTLHGGLEFGEFIDAMQAIAAVVNRKPKE